jgi:hypothetical protein
MPIERHTQEAEQVVRDIRRTVGGSIRPKKESGL